MANPHPQPLTVDARKAGLERRLTYSRKWYKQQLIAIATAQTTMTTIQFRALVEYGHFMGWYAKATPKEKPREHKRPRLTEGLLARLQRNSLISPSACETSQVSQ